MIEIGNINFNNIDTTSKCYTIPNYNYWLSSTLMNNSYGLGVDKLQNVISKGKYNKLGLHGLTINWGGAQITINGETKTINTTPDLLKAIQEASIIDSTISNSDNAIKASVVNEKILELENRIDELENQLSNINNPFNGYQYVDLGLPSGTKWATMNVGAGYITDYGLYFQWGDTQGYTASQVGTGTGQKAFRWSDYKFNPSGDGSTFTKYNTTDGNTVLDLEDDAARAKMGGDWHMPTKEQFQELLNTDNCTNTWTTLNGVNGRLFTSVKNRNTLFFPAAGSAADSHMDNVGADGIIWSNSIVDNNYIDFSSTLEFFDGNNISIGGSSREAGLPVRGVID